MLHRGYSAMIVICPLARKCHVYSITKHNELSNESMCIHKTAHEKDGTCTINYCQYFKNNACIEITLC